MLLDPALCREFPALGPWLEALGCDPESVAALAGDVSARRYFRVARDRAGSAVLAVYPPALQPACERFLKTGELLSGVGIRVPAVYACDCALGFMLVEDLGQGTLFELPREPWATLEPFFDRAVEWIRALERVAAAEVSVLCPPLDEALLARELRQTWEVFLEPHGLSGEGEEARRLEEALAALCQRLGEAPPVVCHRDFMARNLVPLASGEVAVLDHQDLRLGPPFYDLASLLNDSIFPPPSWADAALGRMGVTAARRVELHRVAAQRTLKAVGTYAAFARRGMERHLPLIPPTLSRALSHLERVPEAASVLRPLTARIAASPFC